MQSAPQLNPTAKIVPDAGSTLDKKTQVAEMFNQISGKYDFLNHFLSLGIDKGWRRKAIAEAAKVNPSVVLDVATGTADLAIAASSLKPESIIGIDIAEQMLEVGRKKIARDGLTKLITLQNADSENLPFPDHFFDVVTCAYGVRNFGNLEAGLREMARVLRPGGKVVILEFSKPEAFPMKQLYYFYFRYILPFMGRLISKHATAYNYLPDSVMAFPQAKAFCAILEACGFKNASGKGLTFGVTHLYVADK
jgi:demethylmenaquinone methyltransferase/2-methoxy-6-polyprenyl-1,4-benzoquinol methylase